MFKILRSEMLKVYKLKIFYISIIAAVLFSLISALDNGPALEEAVTSFKNLTNTYFIIAVLSLGCFVYGLEIDNKTIKIIRAKPVSALETISAKFTTAMIYSFLLFLSVFVITNTIIFLFHPIADTTQQDILLLAESYLIEFIASILVESVGMLFVIISDMPAFASIGTFAFFIVFDLLGNLKTPVKDILPLHVINIWQELFKASDMAAVFYRLIICLAYSTVLFILCVFIYRRKEIKI